MEKMKNDVAQCPGSHKIALLSDLMTRGTPDRARCSDCGAIVAVWLADEGWYRRGHRFGVSTDEKELASQIESGVSGAAVSLD